MLLTGAGAVISAEEINVSFETQGVLEKTLVSVGDLVAAGDTLVRVDDTDAQQALANAQLEASLNVAQAS